MSSPNRGRRLVVVLTLITTIVAAVVAGLSVDAGTRADAANRESQYLVLVASDQTLNDLAAENYQAAIVTDILMNTDDGLAHDMSALVSSSKDDPGGAEQLAALGAAARARADAARALSDIFHGMASAPSTPEDFQKVQAYYEQRNEAERAIVARQNAASDTYNAWSSKGDTYVAILSVLAVTFFLLGLAQVSKRMRPFLASCAGALMVLATAWTAAVFVG